MTKQRPWMWWEVEEKMSHVIQHVRETMGEADAETYRISLIHFALGNGTQVYWPDDKPEYRQEY